MNRREIRRAISGQSDLKPVLTDPTRGRHVLDIVVTSFNEYLEIAGVTDPIANDAGTETDHKTVYATFKMPRVPKYAVREYSYYRESEEGILAFGDWMRTQNWDGVFEGKDVDAKVESLQARFSEGMSKSFEWITKKKKTSEPAWMSEKIPVLIRRRRGIFRK